MVVVPFSHLVLRHREIGIHRGRQWGFRDVFGFATLRGVPFVALASKVKDAYEGKDVPCHCGWPAQREALRWLVEKGHDGIYALDEKGIKLMHSRPGASDEHEQRIKLTDVGPVALDEQNEQEIKLILDSSPDAPDKHNEQGIEIILDSSPNVLEQEIKLTDSTPQTLDVHEPELAGEPERYYYISDGHHRALALYVLGEDEVRARILSEDEIRAARALKGPRQSVT